MNKPKLQTKEYFDYNEIIKYIEYKYNINTNDCGGRRKYNEECVEKASELTNGDKSWYKIAPVNFTEDQKRAAEFYDELKMHQPAYLNYWHWILKNHFCEVHNGCHEYWNLVDILESNQTPQWVKKITQLVYDEYQDNLDNEGGFEVYIGW